MFSQKVRNIFKKIKDDDNNSSETSSFVEFEMLINTLANEQKIQLPKCRDTKAMDLKGITQRQMCRTSKAHPLNNLIPK